MPSWNASARTLAEERTCAVRTRIVVLNGADYTAPANGAPVDEAAAERLFDKMYSISQTQRSKYFK